MPQGNESHRFVIRTCRHCPLAGITVQSVQGVEGRFVSFSISHFHGAARTVRKTVLLIELALMAQATLAVSGFTPQTRLGYRTGDQWEPAMAADARGHIYVLYPQYGTIPGCPLCTPPTMSLLISSDNGISWHSSRPILPFPT